MPLSIEQITDSVGKKFLGWITNNGGTNVAAAPKGVNLATQNGDSVADLAVSLDGEIISAKIDQTTPGTTNLVRAGSGATDDGAAAGELYPIAGLYQSTVDEVDAGDVGRLRMSKRRGLINAADWSYLELTAAAPVPSGSDLFGVSGAALASTDFEIRDTNTHRYAIPILAAGWRSLALRIQVATAFDQALNMDVAWGNATPGGIITVLDNIAIPSGATLSFLLSSAPKSDSAGMVAAATTAAATMIFHQPEIATFGYLLLLINASVAPTAGELRFAVGRGT